MKDETIKLGLKENWKQFTLLVFVNAFVGGMVGLERTIIPQIDNYCKKTLLFLGMLMQGLALLGLIWANSFVWFMILSSALGVGTAIVYPTFLAAISDYTHPDQRPQSIGIFRLWRDLGYAIGAILTGLIADQFGLTAPVLAIGLLTVLSAIVVRYRMTCKPKTVTVTNFSLSISH